MALQSRFGHWVRRPIATTASTKTIEPSDFGSVFTNRGGTVTAYTLPTPGPGIAGAWVQFFRVAAGNMSVTAGTGKIVGMNNAAVTTVGFEDDGEEIGQSMTMICDGTSWLAFVDLAAEATGVTIT